MARPKIDIDADEVEMLASFGCMTSEIASFFNCSQDTIKRRFAEEMKKGQDKGRIRLRKLQWVAAENGNVTMLIWLGKQYLGQSDHIVSVNENIHDFKGAVIAAPTYTEKEKESLEKYRRMAMGDN